MSSLALLATLNWNKEFQRELQVLTNNQEHIRSFFNRLSQAGRGVLLLDYDGTLAPFRLQRDEATPYPGLAPILAEIQKSDRTRLVLISGRAVDDLVPLIGLSQLPEIWGSHGWERLRPDGSREIFPMPPRLIEALRAAEQAASQMGDALERKPGCLALHWRGSSPETIAELRAGIGSEWERLSEQHRLELKNFDGGLELRIPGRDKGVVVTEILREVADPEAVITYLGDDLTDEDAFAALEGRGLRVLVRKEERPSRADCRITPPEELLAFLQRWRELTQTR